MSRRLSLVPAEDSWLFFLSGPLIILVCLLEAMHIGAGLIALSLVITWCIFVGFYAVVLVPTTGCGLCGYDTRAHDAGDRCPECGGTIEEPCEGV